MTYKNKYFELRGRERKKQRASKRKSRNEWPGHPSTHLTSKKKKTGSYNVTTHNDAKRSRIADGQKRIQGLERYRIEDRIAEKQIVEARLWFFPFLYHLWKLHDILKHFVLVHYYVHFIAYSSKTNIIWRWNQHTRRITCHLVKTFDSIFQHAEFIIFIWKSIIFY